MRLHNRQIKGSFWSDPNLIYELTREQRMFFIGLTQLAEDSGCLEYDPRSFKILLYPADVDITPETLTEWTEKIIEMGKLIIYEVEGKKYLFIKNFHKHQALRFMVPPEIPLPPWIEWQQKDERERYGKYIVNYDAMNSYINKQQNGNSKDINNDIYEDIYPHKLSKEKLIKENLSKEKEKEINKEREKEIAPDVAVGSSEPTSQFIK